MRHAAALAVFVALVAGAAVFGSQFRPGQWYVGLVKPAWTPPNWLFAPVWTALYVMIAVSGWLMWRSARPFPALAAWGLGLALNAAWSWLFFGRHAIDAALLDIGLLWLSIAAYIGLAWPVSRVAAGLFVPYLAWVSLASALNFAIWRLNA